MPRSKTLCIDAGLVIRLVIMPDDEEIEALWDRWKDDDRHIVAPALLFYEVSNALYRYQHAGLLSAETVDSALQAALVLPIELIEDGRLHTEAKAVAERLNQPATYDAHYLALAERLDAEFWTTDGRFAKAARKDRNAQIFLHEIADQH